MAGILDFGGKMPGGEEAEYMRLQTLGRELTPEERAFMNQYKMSKLASPMPRGGGMGRMPQSAMAPVEGGATVPGSVLTGGQSADEYVQNAPEYVKGGEGGSLSDFYNNQKGILDQASAGGRNPASYASDLELAESLGRDPSEVGPGYGSAWSEADMQKWMREKGLKGYSADMGSPMLNKRLPKKYRTSR